MRRRHKQVSNSAIALSLACCSATVSFLMGTTTAAHGVASADAA